MILVVLALLRGTRELRQPVGQPVLPAVLRNHKYFDTQLQREWLPVELMVVMGFPRCVDFVDLSHAQIASMVGNTMSVPIAGVFPAMLLKHVFQDSPVGQRQRLSVNDRIIDLVSTRISIK